jgi:hypothetical protein
MRNHTVNATSPETFRNLKEYQWATNGGELRTDLQETQLVYQRWFQNPQNI